MDALIAEHGIDNVAGLKVRLKAPVVPGDTLHLAVAADGGVSASVAGKEVLGGQLQLRG